MSDGKRKMIDDVCIHIISKNKLRTESYEGGMFEAKPKNNLANCCRWVAVVVGSWYVVMCMILASMSMYHEQRVLVRNVMKA